MARRKLYLENPDFALEWDREKNAGLDPNDFTGGSERKVWWKCKLGHSWNARINSRFVGGNKCPYCANQKVWAGYNDLKTLSPRLADEWDNNKNGSLSPADITGGSNKEVWWKCYRGHSWQNTVNHRFYRGQNCPYCSNKRVLQGFNDLSTTHPRLAKEWDKKKNGKRRPEHYTSGADTKVWWKCKCGYSWQALIYTRKHHGCPCCAGNVFVPGVNDLRTLNPKIANQWDYEKNDGLLPEQVAANDSRKVWWLCAKNHSWQAVISSRNRGRDCPYCTSRSVLDGFNDLASLRPDIAVQWDYSRNDRLNPKQVTVFSNRKVWWQCANGHQWKTAVAHRSKGARCPYCENRRATPGVNDLKTLRPNLAKQWDNIKNGTLTAEQVTLGSSRKVWWTCDRWHSFSATVVARVRGGQCPYCIGKLPIVGETDFATIHPELLYEWDYDRNDRLRPHHITASSHKKIWWRCAIGHRWKSAAYNRHAGHKCPVCESLKDKHIVITGVNDLATKFPSISNEWYYERNDGLTPQQVLPGSNRKVWWKCRRGHSWIASVLSRTGGSQCPKCNGKTPVRTTFIT